MKWILSLALAVMIAAPSSYAQDTDRAAELRRAKREIENAMRDVERAMKQLERLEERQGAAKKRAERAKARRRARAPQAPKAPRAPKIPTLAKPVKPGQAGRFLTFSDGAHVFSSPVPPKKGQQRLRARLVKPEAKGKSQRLRLTPGWEKSGGDDFIFVPGAKSKKGQAQREIRIQLGLDEDEGELGEILERAIGQALAQAQKGEIELPKGLLGLARDGASSMSIRLNGEEVDLEDLGLQGLLGEVLGEVLGEGDDDDCCGDDDCCDDDDDCCGDDDCCDEDDDCCGDDDCCEEEKSRLARPRRALLGLAQKRLPALGHQLLIQGAKDCPALGENVIAWSTAAPSKLGGIAQLRDLARADICPCDTDCRKQLAELTKRVARLEAMLKARSAPRGNPAISWSSAAPKAKNKAKKKSKNKKKGKAKRRKKNTSTRAFFSQSPGNKAPSTTFRVVASPTILDVTPIASTPTRRRRL